jgi:acyl-coenzyme A synthetase/AMP-(fatty) acid ligase/acyl carrier protein
MIDHGNVVSFFTAMDHAIGSLVPGVWLAVTSIAFDISVLELFWTLTRGFKVVIQGDDPPQSPGGDYSIARNIRTHRVTHLQCTPSLARMLMSDRESVQALSGVQTLLLGGEALPVSLADRIRKIVAGRIYNMYGPTETTIWSTTQLVEETRNAIPIGRPIANTQVYILDRWLRPVPTGAIGELYISGAGVVRGYLNRPELTAERFLTNPFSDDPASRMYKTGDLARYLPSGAIEYVGRMDFQVKLRGHRIELGEIEAVLERHRGVRQAVVTAREDAPGDKRLVAYVVLDSSGPPGNSELRSYLRDALPEYMWPAAFVTLQFMPLTANGKIDRNALPAPESRLAPLELPHEPPQTDLQQRIVRLWEEALNADQIGIHDNFFDLGAHSLLVAEVHSNLQELLRRDLPLVTMFRYPTVAALVGYLSQNSGERRAPGRSTARAQARRESIQRRAAHREAGRL